MLVPLFTEVYYYQHFFNCFLILTVNILTISHAGWKIHAWIDEWAVTVSINEQILQLMMDSIAGWILQ